MNIIITTSDTNNGIAINIVIVNDNIIFILLYMKYPDYFLLIYLHNPVMKSI